MRHLLRTILLSMIVAAAFVMSSCENPKSGSLFDPNGESPRPQPTISTIAPASGLAGTTIITITGTNFSTVKEENVVYFDTKEALILTATATQLTVRAPNVIKDSVVVRVQVFKAALFSNSKLCKLEAAVATFGGLDSFEEPFGIASDGSGNLFASLTFNSGGIGIKKFTAEGVRSDFAPAGGVTIWSALKVGPGGVLYAARTQRAIFTVAQGAASSIWAQIPGSSMYDFDFDKDGNIWSVGNNSFVYRFTPSKASKSFPFVANLRTARVYKGYLYVGGKVDPVEGVWRFPIVSADSLGAAEKYFDLSARPGYGQNGPGVYAITFNTDGDMYVGTDGPDAILIVHPNGTAEPLYPGLFQPQTLLFAWGKGSTLYAVRSGLGVSHVILKINTQKTGAPYYGRGDQ